MKKVNRLPIFDDSAISFKAKGLYIFLMGYQKCNLPLPMETILEHSKDGRESVCSGIKELEEHGYIKKIKVRNEKGHFSNIHYQLFEDPIMEE